jgi:hypothetical protein
MTDMEIPPLAVHSIAEAHLYLMSTPCKLCGTGRTKCLTGALDPAAGPGVLRFDTQCESCSFDSTIWFRLPAEAEPAVPEVDELTAARINPTPAHSEIIDVAQWLTLFRIISEAAAAQTEPAESRRLGYEAAQCIDEALKFYTPDNDLPPADALFHEASRRQFRDRPDMFARARLINLRAKLPTLTQMEQRLRSTGQRRPRKWWKLW